MTTQEQETMESLSRTVTALCQAIDPDCKHGPETEKLVHYCTELRRHAGELARGVFTGNVNFQRNKAKEVLRHLDYKEAVNGIIMGPPQ
jgi:hypothetical protein